MQNLKAKHDVVWLCLVNNIRVFILNETRHFERAFEMCMTAQWNSRGLLNWGKTIRTINCGRVFQPFAVEERTAQWKISVYSWLFFISFFQYRKHLPNAHLHFSLIVKISAGNNSTCNKRNELVLASLRNVYFDALYRLPILDMKTS